MTFLESLHAAMDETDPQGYIDRVKTVVRDRLYDLDRSASIEDTRYFNHSAIPDFSLTWPGERGVRNVFLRDSYDSISAGDDEGHLAPLEPVLISLDNAPSELERRDPLLRAPDSPFRRPAPRRSDRTLVTDVVAVSALSNFDEDTNSPLGSLVRSNFVRGARGHIDADLAEQLVSTESPDTETRAALIRGAFAEDAALRITRTAKLIDLAMTEDAESDLVLSAVDGTLSLAELRTLLPWLLVQPRAASNTNFWTQLGTLVPYADIERIREDLIGLDLTPLVRANSGQWALNWGYLGLALPDALGPNDSANRPKWSFAGGRLGADVGEERIQLAKNGQLVGSRPGSSAARWLDVVPALSGYRLSGVALQGFRRSVTIDAERSDDIRRDVEDVAASLDDEYLVTSLRIRVPAVDSDGVAEIEVDFGAGVVKSTGSGASINDMVYALGRILKYRTPFAQADLNALLTQGDRL
jgi:hypothetical protein